MSSPREFASCQDLFGGGQTEKIRIKALKLYVVIANKIKTESTHTHTLLLASCRPRLRKRSRKEYHHATKSKISSSSISAFNFVSGMADFSLHRILFGFSTAATDKQKHTRRCIGKPNPNLERRNPKACCHHHHIEFSYSPDLPSCSSLPQSSQIDLARSDYWIESIDQNFEVYSQPDKNSSMVESQKEETSRRGGRSS